MVRTLGYSTSVVAQPLPKLNDIINNDIDKED